MEREPAKSLKIAKSIHMRMKVHSARDGLSLEQWLTRVVLAALPKEKPQTQGK
jgi:predicted HicB family RNase H-like nuclease